MARTRERLRSGVAVGGMLTLAIVFASLGQWQHGRAAQSRALAERFAAGADAAPLTGVPSAHARYDRFRLHGRYLPERQILLDNIVADGRAGYYVLTPFEVVGEPDLVLVNRGFVAAALDRSVLPDVTVGGGPRAVTGHVDVLPRAGLDLRDPEPSSAEPDNAAAVLLSYPSAAEIAARLARPVHNYQLRLDAGEPDGFGREWRAAGLAPERHLAYAWQWWALAAAATVTGGVLAVRRQGQRDGT